MSQRHSLVRNANRISHPIPMRFRPKKPLLNFWANLYNNGRAYYTAARSPAARELNFGKDRDLRAKDFVNRSRAAWSNGLGPRGTSSRTYPIPSLVA